MFHRSSEGFGLFSDNLVCIRDTEDPVLMSYEVAESLPIGRRAVYNRLRSLEDRGILRSKKTGARSTVWWYPEHTSTEKQT
jgi:predicted transcriptional regulator